MTGLDIYDRLLDQDPRPTSTEGERGPDVYDQILDRQAEQQRSVMLQSLTAAREGNPDAAGAAQQLASQLGLDPGLVERNLPEIQQRLAKRAAELRDAAAFDPILARQLRDPEFAKIAYDDQDNLSTWERMRSAWEGSELSAEQSRIYSRVRDGVATPAEIDRVSEVNRQMAELPPVQGFLANAAQIAGFWGAMIPEAAERGTQAAVAFGAGAAIGGQLGPQAALPEELVTVPVAVVSGFSIGFGASMAQQSFTLEGGQSYGEMLELGVDPAVAQNISYLVGGLNAGLEMTGLGAVAAPLRRAIAEEVVKPGLRQAGRRFVTGYGLAVGGEAATEFAQELTQVLGADAGLMLSGRNPRLATAEGRAEVAERLAGALVHTAQGMVLLGLPGPGVTFVRDANRAVATRRGDALLRKLEESAIESKTRKRNPDRYAEFANQTLEGRDIETVYFEIDEFRAAVEESGMTFAQLEVEMPAVAQRFQEAERAGVQVAIPTGEYAAHVAPSKLRDPLRPHARVNPDAMSPAEAEAFRQNEGEQRDEIRREAEEAAEQEDRQAAPEGEPSGEEAQQTEREQRASFAMSGARVEARMRDELFRTGKQNQREVALGAKLHRAFVETNARELDLTPEEFDERWQLKVEGPPTHGLPLPDNFTELLQGDDRQGRDQEVGVVDSADARADVDRPGEELRSGERGRFSPKRRRSDSAFLASLTEKADVSTFLHESAHYFLTVYAELASSPAATDRIRADMQELLDWFEVKDLETWNAMSIEEQRSHHETFANNFELYLFEGKAPSIELQTWFDRVAGWLRTLWRQLTGRHPAAAFEAETGQELPPLNDRVRAVMDRMLASEDQITNAANVRAVQPLFRTQEEAGMTDAEWKAYRAQAARSQEAAIASLSRESLRDLRWLANVPREQRAAANEVRDRVRDEVEAEVEQEPVYRALRFLRHGEAVGPDGKRTKVDGPHRLDAEAVRGLLPEGVRIGKFSFGKYRMTDSEGLSPDLVAERFEFSSGEALVTALAEAQSAKKEIEARTERRLFEEHAEFVTPEAMELAVDRALFSEERERLVETEMARHAGGQQPARTLRRVAKQHAKDVISDTLVGRIRPHLHAVAAGKHSRLALQAARRREDRRVAAAKRAELIQIQLAKEAAAAREEVKKAIDDFELAWRSDKQLAKTHNVDVVAAARAVLANHGLGRSDKSAAEHLNAVESYNPDLYAELRPLVVGASEKPKHWEDLTMSEFRGVRDAVDALLFKARRSEVVRRNGVWHSVQDTVVKLVERLGHLGKGRRKAHTRVEELLRMLGGGRAGLTQVEHLMLKWDGGKPGPWTEHVWSEIRERLTDYRLERNDKISELVENIRKIDLKRGKFDLTDAQGEVLYTFGNGNGGMGKAELIGALLHSGNESNLERLLLAERGDSRWGARREDGSLDTTTWDRFVGEQVRKRRITKADMDFVQSAWDLLENLKPLLQRAHREVNGYHFPEIAAKPFSVTFPDGETVEYRGGYVPAKIDRDAAAESGMRIAPPEVVEDFRWAMPQARHGSTKARRENFAAPLVLDVSVIANHIDEVLLFSHVQPAVRDVSKLFRNKDLVRALTRVDPNAEEKIFRPWLERVTTQRLTTKGSIEANDAFWTVVRRNTGIAIMFANPVNTFQQVTGLVNALNYVGGGFLARASKRVLPRMFRSKPLREAIGRRSKYMKELLGNQVFELRDEMQRLLTDTSWLGRFQRGTIRHAYFAQTWTQNLVNMTVWTGAYDQSMAQRDARTSDEQAEAAAVAAADRAVRLSQGSFDPEDVAAYQVSTPFGRSWLQFSGYFNTVLNQVMGQSTRAAQARAAIISLSIPAILGEVIAKTLWGTWDDEDDDGYLDEAGEVLFGSQARAAGALVPGIGSHVTNAIDAAFTDRPFGDRNAASPAIAMLGRSMQGFVDAMRQAADGDRDLHGQALRNALNGATVATGLPFSAIGRPAGFLTDVGRGAVEPTGVFDAIRGTVTGRPSEGSRR